MGDRKIAKAAEASRIRGGFFGLAVGDALGATTELMSPDEVKRRWPLGLRDIVGGGWLSLAPGAWTEDTELTLAVAAGILDQPDDPVRHIGEYLLNWRKTCTTGIGVTLRAALDAFELYGNWFEAAQDAHVQLGGRTAGNGALMRTLPVAFAYPDLETIFIRSMEIARMTHWDASAGLTCFLYGLMVRYFLRGGRDARLGLAMACTDALETVPSYWRLVVREITDVLMGVFGRPARELGRSGYTADTLECALWAVVNNETFEEAVVAAVNLGGDSNTVGALAGGLAGVRWGERSIPFRWINKLSTEQEKRLSDVSLRFRESLSG